MQTLHFTFLLSKYNSMSVSVVWPRWTSGTGSVVKVASNFYSRSVAVFVWNSANPAEVAPSGYYENVLHLFGVCANKQESEQQVTKVKVVPIESSWLACAYKTRRERNQCLASACETNRGILNLEICAESKKLCAVWVLYKKWTNGSGMRTVD